MNKKLFIVSCFITINLIFNKVYCQNNFIAIWKSIENKPVFVINDTIKNYPNEKVIRERLYSLEIERGIYFVYIGKLNLQNYQFPDSLNYDENDSSFLFEDVLFEILSKDTSKFRAVSDLLPNGRWLKVIIDDKVIIILKSKDVKDGFIDGEFEIKSVNNKFHLFEIYENGFYHYKKLIGENGKLRSLGYYLENNKIKLELIYHANGILYRKYEKNKVWQYNEQGKLMFIKKTDDWGNW